MAVVVDELTQPAPDTTGPLFWAVLSSTAGVFVAFSVSHLVLRAPTDNFMTDWRLLGVVGVEMLMALCWIPRLIRRGWTMRHVSVPAAPRDVGTGVLLMVAAYLAYALLFNVAIVVSPEHARVAYNTRIGGRVSLWAAVFVSLANPVAEEFLYLGFVANALRRHGVALALSGSIVVRILVHLYQGPVGVLSNLPIGAVFAGYYLVSRRIWPTVVAHGLMDLIALATLLR